MASRIPVRVREIAFGFLLVLLAATTLVARDDIRTERVRFESGKTSATVKDEIKGYETVDYVLGAAAGQTMTVTVEEKTNGAFYFNVLPPGSEGEAIWVGSSQAEPDRFSGKLEKGGDYKVRVYLMRSAARRDETAKYTIELSIVD